MCNRHHYWFHPYSRNGHHLLHEVLVKQRREVIFGLVTHPDRGHSGELPWLSQKSGRFILVPSGNQMWQWNISHLFHIMRFPTKTLDCPACHVYQRVYKPILSLMGMSKRPNLEDSCGANQSCELWPYLPVLFVPNKGRDKPKNQRKNLFAFL